MLCFKEMENQFSDNIICITGSFSYLFTKYFSFPLIVALFASGLLIIFSQEPETRIKWAIAIILSLFIILCGFYYIFRKLKKVYISPSSLIIDDFKISWNDVIKVHYPMTRPRMVFITYRIGKRSKVIFSVLPFVRNDKIISLISYFQKMAYSKQ